MSATTQLQDRAVQRLITALRDASRAVGAADGDPTMALHDYRQLLTAEDTAATALQAFLAPRVPAGQDEATWDFYRSLHGDNGLAWQIRAQQALGRQEVAIDVGGRSWRTWVAIRRAGLEEDAR